AYWLSALPPGEYTVRCELAGFALVVRETVHVGVGFTATIDFNISPGSVTDTVTVSGAPVIDLASTEAATRFDAERLASLPGARDVSSLIANAPGVAMTRVDV